MRTLWLAIVGWLALSGARAHAQPLDMQAEHRAMYTPRLLLRLGFAPVLVARDSPGGGIERFRTGTVTLGLAFQRHYRPWLGLHAALDVGAGGSRMVYVAHPANNCCAHGIARTGAAYSSSVELAPVFGPFRNIYFSPGALLRVLWPSRGSASVEYEELASEDRRTREIDFRRPIVMAGGRLTIGVLLRARRVWHLGLGVDVARPLYNADRAIGMALNLGVVLGQNHPDRHGW